MNPLKKLVARFRSAMTGRFVTKGYATKHPDVTVKEKRRR